MAAATLAAAAAALGACGEEEGPVPNASAERGRALIEQNGCGTCHVIEGVDGANGRVGPPLTDFKDNRLVAGHCRTRLRTWSGLSSSRSGSTRRRPCRTSA